MPVNRTFINAFAISNPGLFQALSALANQSDALEQVTGVVLGTPGGSVASAPVPPPPQWTITASQGHYLVQIAPPTGVIALVQHQLRSALDQTFSSSAATLTYTLGFGEATRDIVDPDETRYWQIRSRCQGSNWSPWSAYSTSSGVVSLNAGALRTS